jgi:hypothetical protein
LLGLIAVRRTQIAVVVLVQTLVEPFASLPSRTVGSNAATYGMVSHPIVGSFDGIGNAAAIVSNQNIRKPLFESERFRAYQYGSGKKSEWGVDKIVYFNRDDGILAQ